MAKISETNDVTGTRRSSARIKTIESNKAAIKQRKKEERAVAAAAMKVEEKKKKQPAKKKQRVKDTRGDVSAGVVVNLNDNENEKVEVLERGVALGEGVVEVERGEGEVYEEGAGAGAGDEESKKSAYTRVKDTIRSFYKHFLQSVQEEEMRCKKADDEEKKPKKPKAKPKKGEIGCKSEEDEKTSLKKIKSKNKDEVEEKSKAKRPDLKSLSLMQNSNLTLVPKNRIGSIPGVDVGHQFFSRCEMVTVGFHNHWLNGIDYIGASKQQEYPEYKLPITVAIVMSGMYEDDVDNSVDVVYTGQGGNDLLGNKRQISDQVMARGNLGLKHSMEQNVPVRLIRGHASKTSYVGKVYTYDGLYKVVDYWAEKGKSEFTVYKFKLKRVPGQPQLVTEQVFFSRGAIPTSVAELQGLVCEDISGGLENIPIPATNVVDDPPVPPAGLTYIRSLQFANNVVPPSSASGCNCKGSCTNPNSCACARLNGSDFPYVHRDGGRLIEPKSVVFECGPNCGCGPSCINRTTQRGLKYRLEVYKTPMKGWAVRSWDFIPSGAFVCEYIGILKKAEDVHDPENMYIFDIDCLETMKGLGQREKRLRDVPMSSMQGSEAGEECEGTGKEPKEPKYCIDAGTIGNLARYINHSCQPNLFVQCVLSAHHDITQARVILFAADNIQPLKELTYDYGYALDSVIDSDNNIKQLPCYCGAPDCRKRMF